RQHAGPHRGAGQGSRLEQGATADAGGGAGGLRGPGGSGPGGSGPGGRGRGGRGRGGRGRGCRRRGHALKSVSSGRARLRIRPQTPPRVHSPATGTSTSAAESAPDASWSPATSSSSSVFA